MLNIYEVKKLEIAKKLLEEVSDSERFKTIDYHPDLHLGDALQAIDELLVEYYPEGYTPPQPTRENFCRVRWYESLRDRISFGFGELATTAFMVAMLSGCGSIMCWGMSDIKAGAGGTKLRPDFAAQSQMYRGLAIGSLGLALGSSIVGNYITGNHKRN